MQLQSALHNHIILMYFYHSTEYSEDVCDFMTNFFEQIVKKRDQKLIVWYNFINKNSDDFYVLQLCFFDIFRLDHQK